MQDKMNQPFKISYSRKVVIIVEIIVIMILLPVLYGIFSVPYDKEAWVTAIILITLGFIFFFMIKSYCLKIRDNIMTYNSLLSKKVINIDDIEESFIEVGVNNKVDVYRPYIRLIIVPKKYTNRKSFYINFKLLDGKKISILFDFLGVK